MRNLIKSDAETYVIYTDIDGDGSEQYKMPIIAWLIPEELEDDFIEAVTPWGSAIPEMENKCRREGWNDFQHVYQLPDGQIYDSGGDWICDAAMNWVKYLREGRDYTSDLKVKK